MKVKILKTGETNIDSTDIWRFAFHSSYKPLKIETKGTTTLTITAGNYSTSATIAHNLGYPPFVRVTVLKNSKLYEAYGWTPCGAVNTDLGVLDTYSLISFDDTNLYIDLTLESEFAGVVSNESYEVRYKIQIDEI